MSSLRSIIVKYFTSNKLNYWIFLLVILLVLATIYAYYHYYLPEEYNKAFKNVSNTAAGVTPDVIQSGDKVIIYYFTVDWCPYCQKSKSDWNAFSNTFHNQKEKKYNIVCVKVDCTKPDADAKELMKKYDIKGYPTVKMLKDGKVIDYDAKVTEASLTQFVKNMV